MEIKFTMAKISDILFGDRGREDYGEIMQLAESLKNHNFIHPLLVKELKDNPNYKYELVAGGRRYKAACFAGLKEVPVTIRESCTELELKELELIENIDRKQLLWSEECSMKLALDELKKKQHGAALQGQNHANENAWTLKDTAKLLDQSVGKVSQDIKLAKAMQDDPTLKKELEKFPKAVAFKKLVQIEQRKKQERLFKSGDIKTSANIRLGSCVDLIKELPDNSVDLVITDPPFAVEKINTAKGSYSDLQDLNDNSTAIEMENIYNVLFPELYRVMKEGSHFYIFYGCEWYPFLTRALKLARFHVIPVPLIWNKGASTTPFRGYDYQQCYEPILFGCKPPRENRQLVNASVNILNYPQIKQDIRRHVYHKNPDLISFLITQSSRHGELVLDPFCGSGETVKSALRLGRSGLGFELNEAHYRNACEYLNTGVLKDEPVAC
jgi:site-specific DNA-methyltransferase (adenine-specific)